MKVQRTQEIRTVLDLSLGALPADADMTDIESIESCQQNNHVAFQHHESQRIIALPELERLPYHEMAIDITTGTVKSQIARGNRCPNLSCSQTENRRMKFFG
jgi:hypothetical protein